VSKRSLLIERDERETELMLKQESGTPRYIAVEGPIGAGKTTLSELLALRYRAELILERYEENPFLAKFYEDRKRTAFQTQIFFLLSRYRQQQELMQTNLFFTSVVSDYMFEKDRIFAGINLSDDEMKLYDQIERALTKTIPTPDVIIYLQSSVAHLESNIKLRGRPMEKKISRDYLETLVNAYNDFFFHHRETRLIVVNAQAMDFLNRPDHLDQLIQTIERSPHPPVEYLNPLTDELFAVEQ
jgi:deoxyadenosine/deoxycytidine kinase